MTCVVGIANPTKGALIAFDSLASTGHSCIVRADLKGCKFAPWLAFGYTTSYRYGQIISTYLEPGRKPDDPYDWALRELVPQLRTLLRDHGWLKVSDTHREEAGDCLFAVRDRVLHISSDFQVAEAINGWNAVGSGSPEARGVLHALARSRPAKHAATAALEAAAYLDPGVSAPFHYLTTRA